MIKKDFPAVTLNDVLTRLSDDEVQVAAISSSDNEGWGNMVAWNPIETYRYKMTGNVETEAAEAFVNNQSAKGRYIVGYLSYDLGVALHNVDLRSVDELKMPDVYLLSFESYMTFNESGATSISPYAGFENEVSKILQRPRNDSRQPIYAQTLKPTVTREEYREKYEQVQRHITAGDIYQANLTHRLEGMAAASGREIFSRSLQTGRANFGAYIEDTEFEIISCSPERFVRIDSGLIDTFPIKGTRPRGKNAIDDDRLKNELVDSDKDAAELNMITDLMRNDLGEICEIGSVKVKADRVVTQLPTLWHTHSHVTGQLRAGMHPMAALLSLMPGGSITGCPKKRAMEIIDELEQARRGVYTGTIFYITPDGVLDSNIAIRTLIKKDEKLYLSVGGGIVHDSTEADEYQESLDKAAFWRKLDDVSVLSSEILESQFGPTHVDILYQNQNERIIRTLADSDNTVLEVSYVKFNDHGVGNFPDIHKRIVGGESMGKVFKESGEVFSRNQKNVYRSTLPTVLRNVYKSTEPATVVMVEIRAGAENSHYADIIETYHPDVRWPHAHEGPAEVGYEISEFAQKLANLE